jgi:hypothetical protein
VAGILRCASRGLSDHSGASGSRTCLRDKKIESQNQRAHLMHCLGSLLMAGIASLPPESRPSAGRSTAHRQGAARPPEHRSRQHSLRALVPPLDVAEAPRRVSFMQSKSTTMRSEVLRCAHLGSCSK